MSHFKAKIHQIRFLVSVRLFFCLFVCLGWSLTCTECWSDPPHAQSFRFRCCCSRLTGWRAC